ncbi:DUF2793 domain-containing protein [Breoghania sp. L-A4]|uniref:DUF2793 domain-containing protein n=1 Tax=Breoghania sp. L-A4 TaxID=2304600 RepID=UPI000E357FCB|nr:DUF2793 domain-containing protein [Breoghania sp. L-A4]AXS39970.1 DUF2793 domain-containing protein [Breoghania sp. L-A4]
MSDTPRLALPLIMAAQAQKHVTHNEALVRLDALVHLYILDRDLSDPPAGPADGDTYLVAAGASGEWAGADGQIAFSLDGLWTFHDPFAGLVGFVANEGAIIAYTASGWQDFSALLSLQNLPHVGVNTTASDSQRLSVKSDEVVLSHDDVTPGTGSMVTTLNKAAAGNDAGHAFKVGWSTRALAGLFGDEDYAVKVSADGASYRTALSVDRASGEVRFPSGAAWARERLSANRTYHVDAGAGSDGNDGLAPGSAFATIQKAVNTVSRLDLGGYVATIAIADGSYAENVVLKSVLGGAVVVTGNEVDPGNVLIAPAAGTAIAASNITAEAYYLRGLRIVGGGITCALYNNSTKVIIRNLDFGAIAAGGSNRHIYLDGFGMLDTDGNYSISGSAGAHWFADGRSVIRVVGRTITITGAPDFSNRFAMATAFGYIWCNSNTFAGSATGSRYFSTGRSYIVTGGAGAAYLPGDAAGAILLDGRYD